MAKVLLVNGNGVTGQSYTATTVAYTTINFTSETSVEATENNTKVPFNTTGQFSYLTVNVKTNTLTATSTYQFRKNGADGNCAVSIGSGVTGIVQDITHIDGIVSGDVVNYKMTAGATGTSVLVSEAGITFSSNIPAQTYMKWCCSSSAGLAVTLAATTSYYQLSTITAETSVNEVNAQCQINHVGSWKNLAVYVSANARTTDTVWKSRINAGDGTQVVTVGSGVTGLVTDSTHTDTIAAGNLLNISQLTSTGTETLTLQYICTDMINTAGKFTTLNNCSTNFGPVTTNDGWVSIGGSGRFQFITGNSEDDIKMPIEHTAIASNLVINITVNANTNTDSYTFRLNKADTALTVSMTALTTGQLTDSTHNIACVPGDFVNTAWVGTSATGITTIRDMNVMFTGIDDHFLSLLGVGI